MKNNFEVFTFCNSRYTSAETNLLIRFKTTLAKSLNDRVKLPQFIIIPIEDDVIHFAAYDDFGVSSILGEFIDNMAKAVDKAVVQRKGELPNKAVRSTYPTVLWVELPRHRNLQDAAELRRKCNLCIDTVLKQYDYMRMIKLKEWDYNDTSLVTPSEVITEKGLFAYWKAIDASVKFNVGKIEQGHRFRVANRMVQQPGTLFNLLDSGTRKIM